MLQGDSSLGGRARGLRQSMSPPEITLWQALRHRPGGLKFRRQHPSGPYIADCYCHEARLVIEVDGEAHGCDDRLKRDARRDIWFEARGLTTLRIAAVDVQSDIEAVVRHILAAAAQCRSGED